MLFHLRNEFTAYAAMISRVLQSDRVPALHSLPYSFQRHLYSIIFPTCARKIPQFSLFADMGVVLDLITRKMQGPLEVKVAFFGVCYVI
jgi:hypothetical protein